MEGGLDVEDGDVSQSANACSLHFRLVLDKLRMIAWDYLEAPWWLVSVRSGGVIKLTKLESVLCDRGNHGSVGRADVKIQWTARHRANKSDEPTTLDHNVMSVIELT
ncbi:hypothetical protein EGR_02037 [Echinococcus granulosus]|uniref:Uncharacterized protein n=1 Tax=Echinococcus granulosus TaxID=6210 RepID=W6UPP7_ECHGR|nr:hypothetical protein EGR_02037 [Echinococcus granulosus]EUB63233.1 hypothetical protein EGR_02037 [Echinococcus granulosus]